MSTSEPGPASFRAKDPNTEALNTPMPFGYGSWSRGVSARTMALGFPAAISGLCLRGGRDGSRGNR